MGMITRPQVRIVKAGKTNAMRKQITKASIELEKELHKQAGVIVGAVILALWRNEGYRHKRLKDVIDLTLEVFDKIGEDNTLTALRILYEELGIELQNGSGQSYRDIHYLSGTSTLTRDQMTDGQFLYMRKRQKDWCGTQIFAGIMVAMHRKHGWSTVRLSRLMEQVDDIRNQYKCDPEAIRDAVRQECNIGYFEDVR